MSCINFSHFGKGKKTLVLFPGWISPAEKEPKFIRKLSEKYSILSVNLPGYSHNQDTNRYHNFDNLTKELHAELEKKNIRPIAFIGFSMGCRLIFSYNKMYPNMIKDIFIGSPLGSFELPNWASLIFRYEFLIQILRKNAVFSQFCVNMALQNISSDPRATFKPKYVSLIGAFDSLVGVINCVERINAKPFSLYIYGEKDKYLKEAQNKNIQNITIVKGAEHNCVRGNEEELVRIIDEEVDT